MKSGEPLERVYELCDSTYCLGTFIHKFIESELSNKLWSNYPMPDWHLQLWRRYHQLRAVQGRHSIAHWRWHKLRVAKEQLSTTISQMSSILQCHWRRAKCCCFLYSQKYRRNFEAWREHYYNSHHQDTPCRKDILLTDDASEFDYWLSRFVLETRKEDCSPFPSRSIKLILSDLQRHESKKHVTIQHLSKGWSPISKF